ncbi:MAG: epoxyqueuosine reductase [Candidatus Verstraetearchaeota archaeon]|nr:epoxyqueuosine reductase [Candidatus Verstraetearchaeota archaeon]
MPNEMEKQTKEILSFARYAGTSLAGIADLHLLKNVDTYGGLSLKNFRYAVSVAIALPSCAIEMITAEDPGMLYAHAYRTANLALDSITLKVAGKISGKGYRALAVPASMRVDQKNHLGHVSHKPFAWAAGLGWIGRNGLLINPTYGSRIRLATALTDMPLKPGKPMDNRCGECRLCVLSCPSKALRYSNFEVRPVSREEILDANKCYERLSKNKELLAKKHHMVEHAAHICGMCIKVCPFGKVNVKRGHPSGYG